MYIKVQICYCLEPTIIMHLYNVSAMEANQKYIPIYSNENWKIKL